MVKIVLFILFSSTLFAYVNLEPKRVGEVHSFKGEAGIDGTIAKGNTDKESLSFSTKLENGSNEDKYIFIASYTYGQSQQVKDTNKAITHVRYTHTLVASYDLELFSQLEYNEFQSLKNRSLAGINMRKELPFWHKFFLGLGLMYSYLEPIAITQQDTIKRRIKVNSYMAYTYKFNALVQLNHLLFYQPNIEKIDDFTLFSYLQLESKLTNSLRFGVDVKYEYNATPYSGRKMEDLSAKAGIKYRF